MTSNTYFIVVVFALIFVLIYLEVSHLCYNFIRFLPLILKFELIIKNLSYTLLLGSSKVGRKTKATQFCPINQYLISFLFKERSELNIKTRGIICKLLYCNPMC